MIEIEVAALSLGIFFTSRRRHTMSSLVSWARDVYKGQPDSHLKIPPPSPAERHLKAT